MLKLFPGRYCAYRYSLSQSTDPRADGHWANAHEGERARGFCVPLSSLCILGRELYCFVIPSLYQAWIVLHPMLCKYQITSNKEIGKNLALTLLCRPDKLPTLTEKTGHIVWGMVEWKSSLYVLFVIRIYVSKTSFPGDLPTTLSLALPWVAFVFQTNPSESGLNTTTQNGLCRFNS